MMENILKRFELLQNRAKPTTGHRIQVCELTAWMDERERQPTRPNVVLKAQEFDKKKRAYEKEDEEYFKRCLNEETASNPAPGFNGDKSYPCAGPAKVVACQNNEVASEIETEIGLDQKPAAVGQLVDLSHVDEWENVGSARPGEGPGQEIAGMKEGEPSNVGMMLIDSEETPTVEPTNLATFLEVNLGLRQSLSTILTS